MEYQTDRMKPGHYKPDNSRLKEYTVNSYGIRQEFSIPKPADVFVLLFGDRRPLGRRAPMKKAFPAVLENPARRRARNIEVLNYGVSSKSLYYLAKHYFSEVEELEPDMVIFNSIRNTAFYDALIRKWWIIIILWCPVLSKLYEKSIGVRIGDTYEECGQFPSLEEG